MNIIIMKILLAKKCRHKKKKREKIGCMIMHNKICILIKEIKIISKIQLKTKIVLENIII